MIEAEREIYSSSNPLTNWGKRELEETLRSIFPNVAVEYVEEREDRSITKEALESWWTNSYSKYGIEKEEFFSSIAPGVFNWRNTIALITLMGNTAKSGNELKAIHEKIKEL